MVKSLHTSSFFLFTILTLVFAIYSTTMLYADAVSVVTVTYAAGTTTLDASYAGGIFSNSNDTTAYVIGANGGVAYVWKKGGSGLTENTPILNVTLTGSGSARAIEVHPGLNAIYAVTNDKFYKLSSSLGIALQRAEGIANSVRQLHYDEFSGNLYFCTNDVFGTLNAVTLVPTTLYTDPNLNAVFDCAFDGEGGFAYLTGTSLGPAFNADLIKVSLTTLTVVDSVVLVPEFLFGVCADLEGDMVWATESSNARVHKYDMATLTDQIGTITVGTTPRFCSLVDDDQARRLYVSNEGTDNLTIIDIDANAVISTHTVCNLGVTTPRIDSKRLFNTTDVYIPCPEVVNSVLIDNTVSEDFEEYPDCQVDSDMDGDNDLFFPDVDGDGTCDFDFGEVPFGTGDIQDTLPAFFASAGLNDDAANLVAAILVHAILVFTMMFFAWKLHQSPPMFMWVAVLVFGGGLSAAIGFMPLIYFFIEIALVVGAVAAMVKAGVLGG